MKKECIYASECEFQPGDSDCEGCDYWQEDISGPAVISDPFNLLFEDSAIQ